ncbi:MAG: hypothetical protein JWM40_3007 [Frankiales bacterium]|nr:hypothetical protein [Frankiales bacterium]
MSVAIVEAPSAGARKTAAVAAALTGVALFMTVASIDVPHKASDAKLLAWWQESGNRTAGFVSGMSAFCVAVFLPIAFNYLRRLRSTDAAPAWTSFAGSMAGAVSALWLVTGAVRASISHLVDVIDEPLPGADVLRFATGLNYTLLGLSGMGVMGLFIVAVSVVVHRTAALARWVAYSGFFCGGVILVAFAIRFGAFATMLAVLWFFAFGVGIWRQPLVAPGIRVPSEA